MKMQYLGDFAEASAMTPDQSTGEVVDANGNPLTVKVQNGNIIVKEQKAPEFVFKKMIKFGDKSDTVKALQNKLNELGYFVDKIDGIFGFKTLMAVKGFQKNINKDITGRVDAETFNAIYNPPKDVQVQNKQTEQKASGKKKLLLGGISIVGAYLLMKE